MSRVLLPILTTLLALSGALGAALFMYRSAVGALEHEHEARLRTSGTAAAFALSRMDGQDQEVIQSIAREGGVDGAWVVDGALRIIAGTEGTPGARVDLLRVDARRVRAALQGEASVDHGFTLGELDVWTGYSTVRGQNGASRAVLVLEAGQAFADAKRGLRRGLATAGLLALLGSLALGLVAARWTASERARRRSIEATARSAALTQMAAAAAHEIRNPLGVIRGTVELMQARLGQKLEDRDREALGDVLGEVERLKQLTDDLVDLSADRPLSSVTVDVEELVREAAERSARGFPKLRFEVRTEGAPPVTGDPGRLRQVLLNLLTNAAQAQLEGEVTIVAAAARGGASVRVCDRGPGVSEALKARLFEPFATGKETGTGLGLAVSRRLVERQGGTLRLVSDTGPGATFELWLPAAADGGE